MRLSSTAKVLTAALKENQKLLSKGANPDTLITPYLVGNPGLGKTAIVEQTAEAMGLDLKTIIVAQYDPAELAGLAYLKNDSYMRARPDWLPAVGQGILFLDELPQACTMSQNLMAQLTNERRIGEHKLGDGWLLAAAGNLTSNRAGTSTMPTHLRDRLMFLEVEANLDDVIEHFNQKSVHEQVCGYLRYRPDFLSKFDAAADACPSPRSWARASTILAWGLDRFEEFESLKGTVGEAAAIDFQGYQAYYTKMPDPDLVMANPLEAEIPEDPAIMYALCSALAARAKLDNISKITEYVNRFDNKEFAVFCLKDAYSRSPDVQKDKRFTEWLLSNGKDLLR